MIHNERGVVTAFVAIFAFALLLVAGLVVDGGYILAARRTAISEADGAARAGAQAVSVAALRQSGGPVTLDAQAANQRVQQYLAPTGHTGTVSVDGDTVTVDVTFKRETSILGIAGIGPVTVRGHGQARSIRGITAGDD
jgi:uncharacterized membrane protein